MEEIEIFKPRILPRGPIDALIALAVGLFQTVVLFGVPAALIAWLTGLNLLGGIAFLAIYCVWILFTVTKVTVSPEGVRFVRKLGTPGLVPWEEVRSISRSPPRELVLQGWLWPLFPAREMTPSLTASGHYRIQFSTGTAYFPPKKETQFEAAIRKYCGRVDAIAR